MLAGTCACGSAGSHAPPAPAPRTPQGPALGLTEDNAQLLESPAAAPRDDFSQTRAQLSALRPAYVRLLIDWAALAPSPDGTPQLSATVSGCARDVAPCAAYAGVRAELAAIASQQRAAPAGAGKPFEVLIDILGVPAWASAAPSGCALPDSAGAALVLTPAALAGYRSLIDALVGLARSQGVVLHWWSPWNEPNDARFLSPQRARCQTRSSPLSPALYAQLARTMASELRRRDPGAQLVLGELNGITSDSPHATSLESFLAALPEDVLCLAGAFSVHAYASYGPGASGAEPLAALQDALDARGGCAGRVPIWITEAGAGAPHPGAARAASAGDELRGCQALAAQLARWSADPRVGAVFQYSFREDPAFPVGLVSADLRHTYPAYGLWLAYSQRRAAGQSPAPGPAACGPQASPRQTTARSP